ncbi:MAG: hypothetical protein K2X74_21620 [Acetobacteraceae bacterium]|nr:hypothetical protein [Acetobacteraceae bacterium]
MSGTMGHALRKATGAATRGFLDARVARAGAEPPHGKAIGGQGEACFQARQADPSFRR